ncbi:iron transporter [Polaromonas sp. P1(28)-13]|nr:iron transporter [Polaromonas sp. P1(28)-13]
MSTTATAVVLRVTAALLGGYAFSAALVALLAAALPLTGMARSEAVVLAAMLGFCSTCWCCCGPSACAAWRGCGPGWLVQACLRTACFS